MSTGNGLLLAVELDGRNESPRALKEAVTAAERAGFTLVTFGDALVPEADEEYRIDAGTRAAFVSSTTSTIGLGPTVHTLTTEPFFLATQLASLDHTSHGRGAWVVGADNRSAAHDAVGTDVRDADAITREVRDVVDLARRLWDSWEDDAVIRDTATGRYIDRDRLHYVDFASGGAAGGESGRAPFTVKGPAIVPRSPQGQPVVFGRAGAVDSDLVDVVVFPFDPTAPHVPPATRSRRLAELTFTLD
ncbi:MAG: LLM class flavin-dependent oxidoreductase, partial [Rhodococcus fascians]